MTRQLKMTKMEESNFFGDPATFDFEGRLSSPSIRWKLMWWDKAPSWNFGLGWRRSIYVVWWVEAVEGIGIGMIILRAVLLKASLLLDEWNSPGPIHVYMIIGGFVPFHILIVHRVSGRTARWRWLAAVGLGEKGMAQDEDESAAGRKNSSIPIGWSFCDELVSSTLIKSILRPLAWLWLCVENLNGRWSTKHGLGQSR